MQPRLLLIVAFLFLAGIAAVAVWRQATRGPDAEAIARAYARPLPPLAPPLTVYHLGHSLVGRDMPAMLAQLAGAGHSHASQLGWGVSLKAHWEPTVDINGFETENDHPTHRPVEAALASGAYDVLVLTEMVELRDAIRYHDSAKYLRLWEERARNGNPDIRVYLYETWHRLDDPEGWLARLDADLARLWEADILLKGIDDRFLEHPTRVIPAGQVMAHFVRRLEAAGGIGPLRSREDLFAIDSEGHTDPIHISDLGAYLVALTHYAVIYQRSPVGLPYELLRADGTPALSPGAEAARAMQESVWSVVTSYEKTGVRP